MNRIGQYPRKAFIKYWLKAKHSPINLDIKFCSNKEYMTHHTDNSYYYFNDRYKGRRYQFIRGIGIIELRTDTYVKTFEDDPILGWHYRC